MAASTEKGKEKIHFMNNKAVLSQNRDSVLQGDGVNKLLPTCVPALTPNCGRPESPFWPITVATHFASDD